MSDPTSDPTASSVFPNATPSTPPGESQTASPPEPAPGLMAGQDDGWESVVFPGQVTLGEVTAAAAPAVNQQTTDSGDAVPPTAASESALTTDLEPAPEDLVQLIQDLNQCNDALLMRVTELEEALERSQVALQAEIERAQTTAGRLPTEATPGPVQQQIAQLLSELDIANDGLRRTTIHNETLHAEMEASQQRVAQMERECTLLQQRFTEKNTALHQAEETCRDLKARLHRQQRYTLQFKAALEKCLNMSGSAAAGPAPGQGILEMAAATEDPSPVTLPRSQQIQPWSAGGSTAPTSPSLSHLLRGLRGAAPAPMSVAPAAPEPAPILDFPAPSAAVTPEPEIPEPEASEPDVLLKAAPVYPAASPDPWNDPWREETAANPAALFTEPSPWGEPMAVASSAAAPKAAPAAEVSPARPQPPVAPAPDRTTPEVAAASSLPTYLTAQASPSPLVYPLRSQKKIKSIAAVELPSFGRSVRRR